MLKRVVQATSEDSVEVSGKGDDGELVDAMRDLRDAGEEAREEGFPAPSDLAMANAEQLLRAMYQISPRRFEVYPTLDGEIAIDAPDGNGQSVLLLCESNGGALCLANLRDGHVQSSYATADMLPDKFLRKVLAALETQVE
ncbi:MAG: hypothetical protein F4X34_00210 [Chloroflexi bacterium]|nr:hypothetical protein [Chloroflexota bacterium]